MNNSTDFKMAIEEFINTFSSHLNFVSTGQLPKFDLLYKKIICVGLIDTLAKTVYPQIHGNRQRFTTFIENFSKSELWNKVSCPHLMRLLEFTSNPSFDRLKNYAQTQFDNLEPSKKYVASDHDLDYLTILNVWPKSESEITGIKLDQLKHKNLFYNYRNYIIHEMRRPGGLHHDNTKPAPFYYSRDQNGKDLWLLVYPLGFFIQICETLLKNVEGHYISRAIDPYKAFDDGNYFIHELN